MAFKSARAVPGKPKQMPNAGPLVDVPGCERRARRLSSSTARVDTRRVGNAVLLVGAIVFPTALGYALLGSGRAYRWFVDRRRSARATAATAEPIERLCADLRRLNAQLTATENQITLPGKGIRVRALRAAYVDALSAACTELEVAPPAACGQEAVRPAEIYRVEAALRERGLDVREVPAP